MLVLLSAWIPSSPVEIVKVPPDTVTFEFECKPSSSQVRLKVPPLIVISPPAFIPFTLAESVELEDDESLFEVILNVPFSI